MDEFLHFLQGTMKTPTWFSWFHILCICICLSLCVLIYVYRKKFTRLTINLILLFSGIIMILFEIYKLIVLSFNYQPDGKSFWKFPWKFFPFQFCSTPMYIMLLAGILRKGKVYESAICYLSTFSLFAGGFVLFFPGSVFCSYIGINIQTMVVHGGMFIIAFLLLATKTVKHNMNSVLKAIPMFLATLSMALIMNIVWHYCGTDEPFNMFYISPYYPCPMPVLSEIYKAFPYAIYFLIYALGFIGISSGLMAIAILLDYVFDIRRIKKMFPEDNVTPKIVRILRKDL